MKKTVIAILLTCVSSQASAFSWDEFGFEQTTQANTQQLTSISLGAILGTALAGPAGLFAGGALGGMYDGIETDQQDYADLQKAYENLQVQYKQQQIAMAKLKSGSETSVVKTSYSEPDKTEFLKIFNNIELIALFKFAEHELEPFYHQQLSRALQTFSVLPECHVYIEGHADRVGTTPGNKKLSSQRVETVKQMMLETGWPAEHIHTRALGESSPVSQANDTQAYMFDRRVVIRFVMGGELL